MAQIMENVEYLSQEIGPRPAGTEEEQQAAFYIAERLEKDAGLSADIEDIASSSNIESMRGICSLVTIIVTIIAMIIPVFSIPAFVIAAIAAAIYAIEALGNPFLSKALARGASQNVVAKYQPASAGGSRARSRKVILITNADTGKVMPNIVRRFESSKVPWGWICLGAMVLTAVLLLVRIFFFTGAGGVGTLVFDIITIIVLLVCAMPTLKWLLVHAAPYNEGANNNATGVAALLEVARVIGAGMAPIDEEGAEEVQMHGREEALDSGYVPEGAELEYDVPQSKPVAAASVANDSDFDNMTKEQRLASAKAAIAAFTGQEPVDYAPVSSSMRDQQPESAQEMPIEEEPQEASAEEPTSAGWTTYENQVEQAPEQSVAAEESNASEQQPAVVPEQTAEPAQVETPKPVAPAAHVERASRQESELPDWFVAAQAKAKRPATEHPAQRSRYAVALEAAEAARAEEQAAENQHVENPSTNAWSVVRGGQAATPMRQTEEQIASEVKPEPEPEPEASAEPMAELSEEKHDEQEASAVDETIAVQEPEQTAVSEPASEAEPARSTTQQFSNPWADLPDNTDRTDDRIDVTEAKIDSTGRVEIVTDEAIAEAQKAKEETDSEKSEAPQRPSIFVPSITADVAAVDEPQTEETDVVGSKQRAPLADADESGKAVAKGLLNTLPTIETTPHSAPTTASPSRSSAFRKLRSDLPSLSGAIKHDDEDENAEPHYSSVSTVGSFGAAGATGSFAPIGDELLEDVSPDEVYVDDADDSDVEENYTETGAFAGPGYVEMPKSRFSRFKSHFHSNKKSKKKQEQEENTPQEWLDVDEEFDPRQVGKERGSWESFREEPDAGADIDDEDLDATAEFDPRSINDYDDYDEFDDYEDEAFEPRRSPGRKQGGAFSPGRKKGLKEESADDEQEVDYEDEADDEEVNEALERSNEVQRNNAERLEREIAAVQRFQNPDFTTEVWFVALGSEIGYHDGIRAFLKDHKNELRGAIFVNFDALGAGELSVVKDEGAFKKTSVSARMKRYVSKAKRATGLHVSDISLTGTDTTASIAAKSGCPVIHLVGAEDGAVALQGSEDDILESLDEEALEENTNFLVELVKSI